MGLRDKCTKDLEYLRKRVPNTSEAECIGVGEKLLELAKSGGDENCFGLAANQVGMDARVCVLTIPQIGDLPPFERVFYNPALIEWKNPKQNQEWCMSLPPDQSFVVRRYNNVKVKDDKHGITPLKGIASFAVQHEIDHLNGILICDKGMPTQELMERALKARKVPLNSECPCGSGRKFKRCCHKKS
jgi:peptide deformylase